MEINDVIKIAEIQLIATRLERCLCALLLPVSSMVEKSENEANAYEVLKSLREWRNAHE